MKAPVRTIAAVLLTVSACGDRDGMGAHNCPTNYGGGWLIYDLEMEHTEPRTCPIFITTPQ